MLFGFFLPSKELRLVMETFRFDADFSCEIVCFAASLTSDQVLADGHGGIFRHLGVAGNS